MACFMCDVVRPYVELLVDKTIGVVRHVFCFTCIVKEFEKERAKLEQARRSMKQRVEVAKRRDNDIIAMVPIWENEVDELLQLDTKTKQTCFFQFCPNCVWQYKMGKELVNKLEQIKQLKEMETTLGYIDLGSFNSKVSEYKVLLLDALKDDNNYIIGLQGRSGSGKTTLAKEVGEELKQSKQFSLVIHIDTVSFPPNLKEIQDDIAGPLGLKWEDCNESDRPKILLSRLTNGEKILLIIDDVWDNQELHFDFDLIGIPKQGNHNGCRVLVTSRSKQLLIKMDCDVILELDLLTEDESWNMFKRCAGISRDFPDDLIGYGRLILKECKQLPIAIAITAGNLKGQHEVHEWKATLQSLRKIESLHGVDDDKFGIYKCLKVSYDYIKDEKAKKVFLICSLFREDKEISIEVLTRLCIGAGVFEVNNGSYGDARNQVLLAKNKLVNSFLLLQDDEEHVKMHDLVRDVVPWIANKEIQCVNLSNQNQKSLIERERNIKYFLCQGKVTDVFSYEFDGSKLDILIVDVVRDDLTRMEVPDSFFENIVNLQVLYFVGNDYPQPLSLPNSIHLLTNIRSMSFHTFDLGDISILGNLKSVETLELVKCTINELPKLGKLKLLKLEDCNILMNNPFEVITSCSSLEELYFINSFNDCCQEITFPMLQRYHIQKGLVQVNRSLSKYVIFHADDTSYFSEGTLMHCVQTSEFLWLNGIEGTWKNLMPDIVPTNLGMNDIVELYLTGISQFWFLIDTIGSQIPNVLSKLVVLELERMDNLEELFNGPLSFESLKNLEMLSIKNCKRLRRLSKYKLNLCNLKTIKLENCPMLVSLFESVTSGSLVLLEKLQIANCEGMENIISDERREEESREEITDGDDNDNISRGSMFSKLKVIDIEECPRLQYILPFISTQGLKNLEELSIKDCKHLRSLSKCKLKLGNLKTIKLQNFPMLVSLCQLLCSRSLVLLEKLQITNCEGLENIISDEKRNEESIEEMDDGNDNDNKSRGSMFSMLKDLDIEECPRLQYILPFLPTQVLENLEKLSIKDCKHLRSLSKCKLNLYNLKTIKLQNCPMLVSLCQLLYSRSLVLLEKLQIANCEGLEKIISNERRDEESIEEIDDGDDNDNKSRGSMFSMLKDLDIEECPRLQYILPFLPTQGLLVLEAIRIRRCDKLKYIFGQYHSMFSYRLDIWERVQCLEIQSYSMCNIKEINLSHFLKMKSVFILSTTPRMLLLETLTVTNCDELKNIVIDTVDQDGGGNSWGDVLPRLKMIYVKDCIQLEYIFGQSRHDDLQNHNKVDLHLPTLEHVKLCNLPGLVAMSTKQYCIKCPPLVVELEDNGCSQVAIKSFHGFVIQPISKSQGIEISVEEGSTSTHFEFLSSSSGQLIAPEINNQGSNIKEQIPKDDDVRVSKSNKQHLNRSYLLHMKNGIVSNNYEIVETEMNATTDGKQEFVVNIPGLVIKMKQKENSEIIVETKMKQTAEANQEFVVNVSGLEILEVANSQKLLNEKSTSQLREIDTDVKPSQDIKLNLQDIATLVPNAKSITSSTHSEPTISSSGPLVTYEHKTSTQLEGSISDKTAASAETISTDSKTKNEADTQFYAPKQKVTKISVEDGTTLADAEAITSSIHSDSVTSSAGSSATSECEASSPASLKETEKQRIEEGSTSETKNAADTQLVADLKQKGIKLSFEDVEHGDSQETTQINNQGTKNAPPIQLDIVPKQKGVEKRVEETTASTYDKTITSLIHLEDGDGKIFIPSLSIVNTNPTATKYADIGDSHETIAMDDINTLIDDDPLLAFEKLLTGQASISSIRVLLQELKTLMDSSSDIDHLVSNQESKSKLISLFYQLNQHQGMLTSDLKDFVEKFQNFFHQNITRHATSQQVLKKHNQLLDSKSDLMNKLWSAKRTQAHIDSETSTAVDQIHELQMLKLKAECTDWAQQSEKLISALASSKVAVREVEHARNLAKEDFANLKLSFPTF